MMNVIVTGASGFLGSHLVDQLVAQNFNVKCLVSDLIALGYLSVWLHHPQVEFFEGRLCDKEKLEQALKNIDVVFHCAALIKASKKEDFYHTNVEGTQNLLRILKENGAQLKRFVFVSSLAARGPSEVLSPVSHYGKSKQLAEQVVLSYSQDFPVTIVRFPMIYGPRDKETFIFFQLLKKKIAILPPTLRYQFSVIYISDAVDFLIFIAKARQVNGVYFSPNDGHQYAMKELLSIICEGIYRKKMRYISFPASGVKLLAYLNELNSKLRKKKTIFTRDKCCELLSKDWVCDEKNLVEKKWAARITWLEGVKLAYDWYKLVKWL